MRSEKWEVISKEDRQKYGRTELSRTDCLVKVDGANQADLFNNQKIAEGGAVYTVGSNEKSGNINTMQIRTFWKRWPFFKKSGK